MPNKLTARTMLSRVESRRPWCALTMGLYTIRNRPAGPVSKCERVVGRAHHTTAVCGGRGSLTPYRQATVGAYAPTRQNDPLLR
jgi:hypothetical protein